MLTTWKDRSEVKEAIILLVYAGLLAETLTHVTIGLVILGAFLVWFRVRPSSVVRNLITLGVFASYWFMYGKVIDPEVGLNFLTIIIVLKLLEKESERDRYMIFFGIMLLVSAGTLFQRSLLYVGFFGMSFLLLIQDFYSNLKLGFRSFDLGKILLWVLPLTAFLFVFAPRVMNPLGMDGPKPSQGEVGYTPDVNLSQIESLSFNDAPVFEAEVETPLPQEVLYWRGNTLSFTDGWNWPVMAKDKLYADSVDQPLNFTTPVGAIQKIRLLSKQEFLFTLDSPISIIIGKKLLQLPVTKTVNFRRYQWIGKYTVVSRFNPTPAEDGEEKVYRQPSLTKDEKNWIHETFIGRDYPTLAKEIQEFFVREGFVYTLSPGKVPDFTSFMRTKKGFCSHFSSAVAIILRTKGVAARLVSGFQGGIYNKYAKFYTVGQNDAHVWVEAYHDGRWLRVDPTGWIAPDRVFLGGEAFIAQSAQGILSPKRYTSRFAWVNDVQKWFGQWDFRFYRWLEEMDYYGQESLFKKLNFNKEWLFSLIPLLIALFMGVYVWHMSRGAPKPTDLEELWQLFKKKLSLKGIEVDLVSVKDGAFLIEASQNEQKEALLKLWNELVSVTFKSSGELQLRSLKKQIQKL